MKLNNTFILTLLSFLLVQFTFTQPNQSSRSTHLSWYGAWQFGTSEAVAVDTVRSYAFLSSGGAVLTLDISDPSNPVLLDSSIRTMGQVLDIHFDYDDQNLLLACDEAGLEIWDADDVMNPSKISGLEIFYGGVETPIRHVELYNDFAVTENRWGYVHTVNISDPANPFQVAFNGVMGNPAHDISVSDDGYIHATGQQYFVLLKITPNGNLDLISNLYYTAGSVYGTAEASFFSTGGYLYIIDRANGGSSSTSVTFHDIVVKDDMAYMIGDDSFMIYDVSDLQNPSFVGQVALSGSPSQLDIIGNYALISCGYKGMRVVDFSDSSAPVEISVYDGTGVTWASEVSGNYSYLANSSSGISIIDISNPAGSGPEKVSGIPSDGETRDLVLEDDVLYFADWTGGLRIYDINDPLNPVQLGSIQNINAWRVDINDDDLYLIISNPNNPDTLRVYDVSNPSVPVMESFMILPNLVWKIQYYEGYLYVATNDDGLVVIDVSNPSNPIEVATIDLPSVSDFDIENNTAYIASTDWDGGLVTVDISDPENPQVLNIYNPSGWFHPFHVSVEGGFVYTSENFGKIRLFDVSNPTNPQELDEYVTSGSIVQMTSIGSFLYVSDGPDGFHIMQNDLAGITAAFSVDDPDTCEGNVVNFTDQSTGGAVSWSWIFEGGTPGTSTDQNPSVTYNTTGSYDVELIVSDGSVFDTLLEQDFINIIDIPDQADIPEGNQMVCNDQVSEYTSSGASFAEAYTWLLTPETAGTMDPDGDSVEITWSTDFTGSAMLYLYGSNECGDGPSSATLVISVAMAPSPSISGPVTVCSGFTEEYSTPNNPGCTYNWELAGGTITSGEGTSQISVLWGDPGEGSLAVTEETSEGCTDNSETFYATVEECTDIKEQSSLDYRLYPNPVENILSLSFDEPIHSGMTFTVLNIMGKKFSKEVLVSADGQSTFRYNASHLKPGLYVLQVNDANGLILTAKFIKK